jgi:hypothetical protein
MVEMNGKPPLTGGRGCAFSVIKGCQPQAGCHPYKYFEETKNAIYNYAYL